MGIVFWVDEEELAHSAKARFWSNEFSDFFPQLVSHQHAFWHHIVHKNSLLIVNEEARGSQGELNHTEFDF